MVSVAEVQRDMELTNKFIDENKNLVWALIRRNFKHAIGTQEEEYFQCGLIGLWKAIRKFKPEFGFAFSTYASSIIIGEIKRYRRDYEYSIINVSRPVMSLFHKVNKLKEQAKSEDEICAKLGVSREDLNNAIQSVKQPILFGDPAFTLKDGSKITIEETIDSGFDTEEEVIRNMELEEKLKALRKLLSNEQFQILRLHLKSRSQAEIARAVKTSQPQVSRTLIKIKKMAKSLLKEVDG